jgi:hypothetical protein
MCPNEVDNSSTINTLSDNKETCDHLNSDDEDSVSFEDCKSSMDDDMPDLEIVATDFLSDDDHFHDAEKGGNSTSNSALGNAFLDKRETLHIDNDLPPNDGNDFFDDTGNIKEVTSTQINVYDVLDADVNQTPQCQKKIIKGEKVKQSKIVNKDTEMKEQKNYKIKRINSTDSDDISFDRIAKERPISIVDSILLGNIIVPQNTSDNDTKDSDTQQTEDEELLLPDSNSDQEKNIIVDNTNLSIDIGIEIKHDQDINVENATVDNTISDPMCIKSTIETNESKDNSTAKLDLQQTNNVIIDHNLGNNVDTDTIITDTNTTEGTNSTADDGLVNEALNSIDNQNQSSDEDIEVQKIKRIKKNRDSCFVDAILASGSNLNLTKEHSYTNTETNENSAVLVDDNSNAIENQHCSQNTVGIEQNNQNIETTILRPEEINTKNSETEDIHNVNVETNTFVDNPSGPVCIKSNEEPEKVVDKLITKTVTEQSNDVIIDQTIGSDTITNDVKDNTSTNKDEISHNDSKKCDTNTSETDDSLVNEVLQSISNKSQNCDEDTDYQDNDEQQRMRIKKNRGSCLVDTILASGSNLNLIMANDNFIDSSHKDEQNNAEKQEANTSNNLLVGDRDRDQGSSVQNTSEKPTHSETEAEKKESGNILLVGDRDRDQGSSVQNTSEKPTHSETEAEKKESGSSEQELSVQNTSEKATSSEELEAIVHRQEVCQAVLSEITEIVSNPTTRIQSRNSSRNESREDVNLIGIGDVTSVMDSKKNSAVSAVTASGEISGDWTVDTQAHNSKQSSNVLLAIQNSGEKNVTQTTEDSCTSDLLHDSGLESESSNSGSVESISAGNMFIRGNATMGHNKIVSPTSSPEVKIKSNTKIQEKKSSSEVLQKNMTLLYENSKEGKERQNSIVDNILSNRAQDGEITKQNTNSLQPQNKNPMALIHLISTVNEVNENSESNDQNKNQFHKDEAKTTIAVPDQSCELTEILPLCESMSLSEYMSLKTDETNKDHDEIILEMVQNSLKQLDFIESRYRGLNTALEEKQADAVQKLNVAEENFQEIKREYDHGLATLSSELINTDSNEERLRGIELVLASEEDTAVKLDRIKMLVTYGTGNTGDKKKLRCSKANRKYHTTRRRGTPTNFWKRRTNQVTFNTRTKTCNITDTKHKEEVTDHEKIPEQSKLKKKTKMKKQITRTSSKTKMN